MRSSKALVVLATAAAAVGIAACNESFVPDYNAPTTFLHTVGALQSEFTGMIDAPRADVTNYALLMEGFGRNAAYYTSSESRFVTQWTGQEVLDNSNFGAGVWANTYSGIKVADSVISLLPVLKTSAGNIPAANQEAIFGAAETIKALDYMYIAESHDTNGVVMNGVGLPLNSALAPILCNKDVWQQIVAMLDSAVDSLNTAGAGAAIGLPGTTNTANLSFPSTYALVAPPGATTAGTFLPLTLALRGKARVEFAYAVARASAATAPTPSSPGSPSVIQLDSAITDIQASAPLYVPKMDSTEAIPANDAGVFHYFSAASGDRTNTVGSRASAIYVMADAFAQLDTTDKRFVAKFIRGTAPTSAGASSATPWFYGVNIGLATPIPIVRNLELHFILAQALIGTGQYAAAIQSIDSVRVLVGHLPSEAAALLLTPDYPTARDFLLQEQRSTLILDGTGDRTIALREYGLVTVADTTWIATKDYQTSDLNIPLAESNARGGNIAPSCP